MPFMETCVYSRNDRNSNEVRVHFSDEPNVFHDQCFSFATLEIDGYSEYFVSFDHSIDSGSINCLRIKMLQGMATTNRHKRYGAILLSALFEYMVYLENLYGIEFSYIDGDLKKDDKKVYYRQTEKKLTDFYTNAITYILPYLPNRKLEIHFYVGESATVELFGKDIESAGYFRYIITKDEAV